MESDFMLVHEIAAYPGTPISRLAHAERSEKIIL